MTYFIHRLYYCYFYHEILPVINLLSFAFSQGGLCNHYNHILPKEYLIGQDIDELYGIDKNKLTKKTSLTIFL